MFFNILAIFSLLTTEISLKYALFIASNNIFVIDIFYYFIKLYHKYLIY